MGGGRRWVAKEELAEQAAACAGVGVAGTGWLDTAGAKATLDALRGRWRDQNGSSYDVELDGPDSACVNTTRPTGAVITTAALVHIEWNRGGDSSEAGRVVWGKSGGKHIYALAELADDAIVWKGGRSSFQWERESWPDESWPDESWPDEPEDDKLRSEKTDRRAQLRKEFRKERQQVQQQQQQQENWAPQASNVVDKGTKWDKGWYDGRDANAWSDYWEEDGHEESLGHMGATLKGMLGVSEKPLLSAGRRQRGQRTQQRLDKAEVQSEAVAVNDHSDKIKIKEEVLAMLQPERTPKQNPTAATATTAKVDASVSTATAVAPLGEKTSARTPVKASERSPVKGTARVAAAAETTSTVPQGQATSPAAPTPQPMQATFEQQYQQQAQWMLQMQQQMFMQPMWNAMPQHMAPTQPDPRGLTLTAPPHAASSPQADELQMLIRLLEQCFGDEHLAVDPYLRSLMVPFYGWIAIGLLQACQPSLRNASVFTLGQASASSPHLEVDSTGTYVRVRDEARRQHWTAAGSQGTGGFMQATQGAQAAQAAQPMHAAQGAQVAGALQSNQSAGVQQIQLQ